MVPDPLEVRRVVLVDEELIVLGPVGAVGIAEHRQGLAGGQVVAGGHQFGALLLLLIALKFHHCVEDTANQPLDDAGMVFGEVGSGEPDVGDQLVGRRRGDQQTIASHLFQVVDVRSPGNRRRNVFLRVERRRRLERIGREDHLCLRRLHTAGHQHVQREVV